MLAPRRRANSPLLEQFVQNKRGPEPGPRTARRGRRTCTGSTPSGWSTTSTSSKTRCARCAATCRRATMSCCPSSRSRRFVGYPRVYALALALVAHTDSELDETRIAAVRPGVPGSGSPDDRRALGVADHAPPRAPGKPQAPVGEDDLGVGRKAPRRDAGRRCRDRCRTA